MSKCPGKNKLKEAFKNTKCPAAKKCPANPANEDKPKKAPKTKKSCCGPKKGCCN